MTISDPDLSHLSRDFGAACAGYLRTPARDLAGLLHMLPAASSLREKAIAAAIANGVRFPERWEANRAPIRFRRTPEEALAGGFH